MRKTLDTIKNFTMAIILISIGLILVNIFSGCSAGKLVIADKVEPIILFDTIETTRTQTDTILLAGEAVPYFDSVLCPPNLTEPQYFYVHDTIQLPPQSRIVTRTERDTIYVPKIVQTPGPVQLKDMSWPERLTWITSLFTMLFGWWKKWKDEPKKTEPTPEDQPW